MEGKNNPMKLDANESAFFKRELEYIKTKTYDTKYKDLKAFMLLPISTEASNAATEITWRSYSGVGVAKIISDYAKDFPRVDVYGEENTVKPRGLGDSYGYSIEEIRRSQQVSGKKLDQRRAGFARRAIEQLMNKLAWFGDSNYNIQGFIDYPGISEYTVPNDGTGSSKEWKDKSPDLIIRDVTGLLNSVVDPTNGKEQPDTLLIPIEQYLDIQSRRVTDGDSKTVLTYLLENIPMLKTIEWLVELKGAGAGGTDRMMIYPRMEENLTFEIPQMFEQFSPQQRGMEFEIPCHGKTAGVIVYYPQSVAFGDGI